MASIKFSIQGKGLTSNIYLRLSVGRGRDYKRKTLYTINSNCWSKSKGMPITKNEGLEQLNYNLAELELYILKNFNQVLDKQVIDGNWVEKQIYNFHNLNLVNKNEETELTYQVQYIIDHANSFRKPNNEIGLSKSRVKSFKTFKNRILDFEREVNKNNPIYVEEINYEFGEKFKDWLFAKNYRINYVGKNIANLKTVCVNAQKRKVPVNPDYKYITTVSEKKEDEAIIYLDENEQRIIKETKLEKSSLVNARKWLLLGCLLGQRFSDLVRINLTSIKNYNNKKIIELRQQKTKKAVVVPILPEAMEIIESGFPHPISLQKANIYFKSILKEAEIDTPVKGYKYDAKLKRNVYKYYPKHELISTHACRRSFATNFYGKIPTPILMNITGHGSEKMFLKYIGKNSYDYAHQMLDYLEKI